MQMAREDGWQRRRIAPFCFVLMVAGWSLQFVPAAAGAPPPPRELALASGAPAKAKPEPRDEVLCELFHKNKLFSKSEYPKIRKVYADRFAAAHEADIRQCWGESGGPLRRWLDERPDIKEELYLAIDPRHDDAGKALTLFKTLKEQFPEKFPAYANLAIAVSVVWDNEKAVHRSPTGQHHSLPPDGQLGAVENFKYYVDNDAAMQGRAQMLPWEFLVHVVDHRTPLAERQWALARYLPRRVMVGKCYSDVPYDHDMLRGQTPKLSGKQHTLPNQLAYGGVCSCQADFAARVAKSIGVPSLDVHAESKFGEGHAWVMWVELGALTRTGFTFSLQSHGRYLLDNYYVGNLTDPHTGRRVTDRQTELRLHTLGTDPIAKRQADLLMRSYPMLREAAEMDVPHELTFLGHMIDFCPGNEAAWRTLAQLSRDGKITKSNSKPMVRFLDRLLTTFRSVPDFTWVVFDDMVTYEDRPKQRALLFSRVATLYQQAGRADLSCEAVLKCAEQLKADERSKEATDTLAGAILAFPDEGRYVPKLLDKLEELCRKDPRQQDQLVRFYQQFLPKIPPMRGDEVSPYCMQMYKRAIDRFQEAGAKQPAQFYQAELLKLQAKKAKA